MFEVSIAILVVAFAMFVRGFTGFGGALLTVPLLSVIWDLEQAIVTVAIIQIVTGGLLTLIGRRSIARRQLAQIVAWSLGGLAAGTIMLSILPVGWLARGLGVFSVGAGLNLLLRRRYAVDPARPHQLATGATGLTAGLFQGMVGTGGPVIVPYLQRLLLDSATLRSTLLAYFLILDLIRFGAYIALDVPVRDGIIHGFYLLPVAIIAALLGGRAHIQVSEAVFRIVVSVLLILAGISLVL